MVTNLKYHGYLQRYFNPGKDRYHSIFITLNPWCRNISSTDTFLIHLFSTYPKKIYLTVKVVCACMCVGVVCMCVGGGGFSHLLYSLKRQLKMCHSIKCQGTKRKSERESFVHSKGIPLWAKAWDSIRKISFSS
jgi:hypothetical protein